MQLTVTGTNSYFLVDSVFDGTGTLDHLIIDSPSAGTITLTNTFTDMVTTLSGDGLVLNLDGSISGVLTSLTFEQFGAPQASITGIAWSAFELMTALEDIAYTHDFYVLADLMDRSDAITIDASGAVVAYDGWMTMVELYNELTTPITYIGSPFGDTMSGGLGDDLIQPGQAQAGLNVIFATLGDDTVDFAAVQSDQFGLHQIVYNGFGGILKFKINAALGVGTVDYALFSDTLLNVDTAMTSSGLSIVGGIGNDSFRITGVEGGWLEVYSDNGTDSFFVTLDGTLRLSFDWGYLADPVEGVDIDLSTGVITNDGFGNTEQITVLGGDGLFEIKASNNSDLLYGSDRGDRFIPLIGDDTIHGGAGNDTLRYDHGDISDLIIDLEAGTVSGRSDGIGFTDQFTGIETFWASAAADTLLGDNGAQQLSGLGGDDTITAGRGDDTVDGGWGDDLVAGQGGDDIILGHQGADTLKGGTGNDSITGGDGDDSITGQRHGDTLDGGWGQDTIKGGGGSDLMDGADDDDFLKGGTLRDTITGGSGDDTLLGNRHDDSLSGGEGMDSLNGGGDNDTLIGGGDDDWMKGGTGADLFVFEAGDGNDTIADFDAAQDSLVISAGSYLPDPDFGDTLMIGVQVDDGYLVSFNTGDSILFQGIETTEAIEAVNAQLDLAVSGIDGY